MLKIPYNIAGCGATNPQNIGQERHVPTMDPIVIPLLFLAAFAAGALNAVAGGGSFISFPALLFAGIPAVSASATNTAALWPGSAASVGAYRREFVHQRS